MPEKTLEQRIADLEVILPQVMKNLEIIVKGNRLDLARDIAKLTLDHQSKAIFQSTFKLLGQSVVFSNEKMKAEFMTLISQQEQITERDEANLAAIKLPSPSVDAAPGA